MGNDLLGGVADCACRTVSEPGPSVASVYGARHKPSELHRATPRRAGPSFSTNAAGAQIETHSRAINLHAGLVSLPDVRWNVGGGGGGLLMEIQDVIEKWGRMEDRMGNGWHGDGPLSSGQFITHVRRIL